MCLRSWNLKSVMAARLTALSKASRKRKKRFPWALGKTREDVQMPYPGVLLHQNKRLACERDRAPFAILCFVEGQGATFQVYV